MKYRSRKYLLRIPGTMVVRGFLKRIQFGRLGNISLYHVLATVVRNMQRHEIIDRANAVSFNLMLAVFPAVIFLFTLIPYISIVIPEINQANTLAFLGDILPRSMVEVVTETVLDIVMNQRSGLLTLGFFVALFLATNGMMALIRAFNACYRTKEIRSAWRTRWTAIWLTLVLALVLFLTVTLMFFGQLVVDYVGTHIREFRHLSIDEVTLYLFDIIRFGVVFIGFLLGVSSIYYFGPSVHYDWKFFSLGSFLATVLSMILSYGFSAYVSQFGSYNKLYGSIGVLIALMVWIQMLTFVLLAGYELNATIHQLRDAGRKVH